LLTPGILEDVSVCCRSPRFNEKRGYWDLYRNQSPNLNPNGVWAIPAIPVIKQLFHLPITADPSHATGMWEYVGATAEAAVAAGADGLIIEVHQQPDRAWSDGSQSLKPEGFARLVKEMRAVAQAVGRDIQPDDLPPHVNGKALFQKASIQTFQPSP
jgi:hypothetical protein